MAPADELPPRTVWIRSALLGLLALAVFAGAVPSGFAFDDRGAIETNPVVTAEAPLSEVFARDFWGTRPAVMGMFRPVITLWFRFDWALSGGNPSWFHLVNVLLHVCVVVLSFRVGLRIIGERAAVVGAAFLAVFAAAAEAVQGLVGRADLVLALCALVGLAAHRSGRSWLAWLSFAIALGSKESAIVLPVAWLAIDYWRPTSRHLKRQVVALLPCALVVGGYALLRARAVGGAFKPPANELLSPLGVADTTGRIFGAGRVFVHQYLKGMIDPFDRRYLCTIPECSPTGPSDVIGWIGLLLFIALIGLVLWFSLRMPVAAIGPGWFLIFFAPISNFLTGSTTSYAERLLYVPAIGLGWALGTGVSQLRSTRLATVIMAAWLALNAVAIQLCHSDWRSTQTLFISGLEASTNDAAILTNAAHAYFDQQQMEEAAQLAQRALELWPESVPAASLLGGSLDALDRPNEANEVFQTALNGPGRDDPTLMTEYARFLAHRGRLDDARQLLARVLAKHPSEAEAKDLATRVDQAIRARDSATP